MGIVSLGRAGTSVSYTFDTPIALLSSGAGYWGEGPMAVEGNRTISGEEGHGAIQFAVPVSSVTWTVVGTEVWHGFTVGIPDQ